MQFSTIISSLIIAATSINAAPALEARDQVGQLDFWSAQGCAPSGSFCNHDFPIERTGCTAVPAGCSNAGIVTGLAAGCTVTLWTDSTCTSVNNFIEVSTPKNNIGVCQDPGAAPIGSISAVCV
ncbi:uncharacterized protein BP5553_07557 [Venustampulla echinocandica]|uniref:Uncharacterized protein n=1 Tax=Venustampulla echinocandica TaxID=2656787 RepID=A0A370TGU8_9HELO|nr:uncharacterized protein BP5553_07557 [Venustampulla echinocandica]RDL34429.1 hypothetical protein BP5553_07557 [Venustampulla echinocandica]